MKCPTKSSSPDQISSEEIKSCLTKVSLEALADACSKFANRWPSIAVSLDFTPVTEPKSSPHPFLTECPWQTLTGKSEVPLKKVPWIIGTTEDEGIALYSGYILQDDKLIEELDKNWDDLVLTTLQMEGWVQPGEEKIVSKKLRKFYFGDKPVSKETRVALTNFYSDAWFVHSVRRAALKTTKKSGAPVYLYQYANKGPMSLMKVVGYPIADEEAESL